MAIREGRWLCQSCGAENLGRNEECNGLDNQSGCGDSRAPGVRFYVPEDSPILTDPALLADANSGADWNCDHCTGANKGAYGGHPVLACVHCGNARDSSDKAAPVRRFTPGSAPRRAEGAKPERRRNRPRLQQPAVSGRERTGFPLFAVIAVFLVAAAGFLFWVLLATKETTAFVEEHAWSRSIVIEEYGTLIEEGWDAPFDARILSRDRKIRDYEQVYSHSETRVRSVSRSVPDGTETYVCGTIDLGNGYFRDETCSRTLYKTVYEDETYEVPIYEDVPVHDDWLTYEIDRWYSVRTARARDTGKSPHWPAVGDLPAHQRQGSRSQSYTIFFFMPDRTKASRTIPFDDWKRLEIGDPIALKLNAFGAIRSIDWRQ